MTNEQVYQHMVTVLWRSLNRLHHAVKECARIGFQESRPTTNQGHFAIWKDLNEAQADAALKLKHFAAGLPVECDERPIDCSGNPYLLDTPEKVEWANKHVLFGHAWRLGDHCTHRPAPEPPVHPDLRPDAKPYCRLCGGDHWVGAHDTASPNRGSAHE